MKKNFYFLLLTSFLLPSSTIFAQNLVTIPDKPSPGDQVTVVYDAKGSKLEDQKNITATAFLFNSDEPEAVELNLTDNGEGLIAQLSTKPNTKAILFSFNSEDGGLIDNNNKKGYKILMYKPDQSEAVPGAYASKALIYQTYNFLSDLDRNSEKAFNLLKREFKLYPASKNNATYFSTFAFLAKNQNDEEATQEALAVMEKILADKNATDDQLTLAGSIARNLDSQEKYESIQEMRLKRFPKSTAAQIQYWNNFSSAENLEDKIKVAEEYAMQFEGVEGSEGFQDRMYSAISREYAKAEDWDNYTKYLNMVSDPTQKAGALNGVAWKMSGESLEAEPVNLEKGKEFSWKSLEMLKQAMESPGDLKPPYMTPSHWKRNIGYSYAMYADTYALLSYKSGDVEDALHYQQIACEKNDFKNGEMAELYSVYFEKVKGGKAAEKLLTDLIAEGKATSKMKERHKALFLENNTVESAYDKYLVELERTAKAKMRAEMEKKMIQKPAPAFALVNLSGKEVSLESLKGKVVVVDFWATWCGPCIASFPGMQKAVDMFNKNDEVEFLFVNTWESVEDKNKNASDFIKSKGYSFQVLMDNESKMVADFGVSGIPTKFIIDKEGQIRFVSKGYGGNDEELVNELSLMIEMAGGAGGNENEN